MYHTPPKHPSAAIVEPHALSYGAEDRLEPLQVELHPYYLYRRQPSQRPLDPAL